MGRQVGQEDTARDRQDADAPQEGDLLLRERRAAAHGAAAEAAEGRAAACGKGGTDAGRADARPNAKGEHTWTCVMRLCYAFLPPLKNAPMISMTTKTIR